MTVSPTVRSQAALAAEVEAGRELLKAESERSLLEMQQGAELEAKLAAAEAGQSALRDELKAAREDAAAMAERCAATTLDSENIRLELEQRKHELGGQQHAELLRLQTDKAQRTESATVRHGLDVAHERARTQQGRFGRVITRCHRRMLKLDATRLLHGWRAVAAATRASKGLQPLTSISAAKVSVLPGSTLLIFFHVNSVDTCPCRWQVTEAKHLVAQGYGYLFRAAGSTAERDRQRAAECFLQAATVDPSNPQTDKGLAELGLSPPVVTADSAPVECGGQTDLVDTVPAYHRVQDVARDVVPGNQTASVPPPAPVASPLPSPSPSLAGQHVNSESNGTKSSNVDKALVMTESDLNGSGDAVQTPHNEIDWAEPTGGSVIGEQIGPEASRPDASNRPRSIDTSKLAVDIISWQQHHKDSSGSEVKPFIEFTVSVGFLGSRAAASASRASDAAASAENNGGSDVELVHHVTHRFSSFKLLHQQIVTHLPHSGGELAASEAAKQLFSFSLMTWFDALDPAFISRRRHWLQVYLDQLCRDPLVVASEPAQLFLGLGKNKPSIGSGDPIDAADPAPNALTMPVLTPAAAVVTGSDGGSSSELEVDRSGVGIGERLATLPRQPTETTPSKRGQVCCADTTMLTNRRIDSMQN